MARFLLVAFTIAALAPSSVRALTDGGPPNGACSAGSTTGEWLDCGAHADCPADQVCLSSGVCGCECTRGEVCNASGCECCPTPEVREGCHLESVPDGCPRLVCPADGGCSAAGRGALPWALIGFLLSSLVVRARGRRFT